MTAPSNVANLSVAKVLPLPLPLSASWYSLSMAKWLSNFDPMRLLHARQVNVASSPPHASG